MEYEQIKKLINDMGESKIDELKLEFPDGIKINMKKNLASNVIQEVSMPVNKQEVIQTIENNTAVSVNKTVDEDCKIVKSPMVGTFYSKSSPTEESFVKVGQKVKKGDVLCIIEAMKLMNEIESEFDGEVVEICVNDEDMIEYGQSLFKIK